jgi:hypothetical protein
LLALAAATALPAGPARAYSAPARRVIDAARTAMGGRAWLSLSGWHEVGVREGAAYEAWIDPLRYGLRVETPGEGGKRLSGFNGLGHWEVTPAGQASGTGEAAALRVDRTRAFFDGWLFFFPSRFEAKAEHLGSKTHGGRAYQVVRVRPEGGSPRELWFDARNHLLARIVDRTGAKPSAVRVTDYRRAGALLVPHRYEPEGQGAGARRIERLTFETADRAIFSMPPPPPPPKPPEPAPEPPKPPAAEPAKRKRRWPWRR